MKKHLLFISAIVTCLTGLAQAPTVGLVAHYTFDGNANDISGNNNNGTVNAATLTSDRNGNPNSAYSFNGSTGYIDIPHSSSLSFASNAISISFWAKILSVPSSGFNGIIISKQSGSGATQQGFNLFANTAQTVGLTISNGGGNFGGANNLSVSLNQYHHFTYTYDNGVGNAYLDGALTSTVTGQTAIIGANTMNLLIGKANWSNINAPNFNGVIDEMLIYNRALTSTEVGQIYTPNCSTPDINTGLVAQYDFTGNANDLSGNNHNGVVNGATLTTDRFGNPNSAYLFNGTTNYIDCGTSSATIDFSSGITFCAWINSVADTNASIIDKMGSTGSGNGFRINVRAAGNGHNFWASQGEYGIGVAAQSTSTYTENNWYFITGSWGTDDSLRIYFNSQLQNVIYSPYNYSNTQNIFIGRGRLSPIYEFFNGVIDDIRIYNRPLTTCDLDSLYNMTNTVAICTPEITTNIVAQYDFTGNANDVSGNGNNGTVNGATLVADRFGNPNCAYSFNGSSNYIEVANSSTLNFSNNTSFSISAWLKLAGSNTGYSGIVAKMDGSGNGYQFVVGNNNITNKLATEFGQGAVGVGLEGNQDLNDGNWHHVMYVVDRLNNKLSYYVDNVLDAQIVDADISAANIDNTANLRIGTERMNIAHFFGTMDDIKIYNKALTDCDIDSLFNTPNSTPTGIKMTSQKLLFNIYPNPATEKVTIEFNSNESKQTSIELFDLLGNNVRASTITSALGENKVELNLQEVSNGIYFMRVNNTVQKIQVTK